ncbi:hypothetical protein WG68_05445 [Arsukibacterium ikkense]|uniref:DUF1778 domain-containing protein n=1 Tax=Arsukibacterium ikkense TaxID=336831 RepID=A0A0M2V738_9GAMM|nr:DUF1778 domain-containing protein [Arsukibacterium ikkense]KKO46219.1 hypothetical protein WG68_05445 [Arsukibacterium ikkense]
MTSASPRITARVDSTTQDLLSQAAAIAGIPSINAFVLSAAVEKAKMIIEREQTLKLSARDAMLLMHELDKPVTANTKLKAAYNRYGTQD